MSRFSKVVPPVALIALGVSAMAVLVAMKPRVVKRPPGSIGALVAVIEAAKQDHPVTVVAMGTVKPSREVRLVPQVSGKIVYVSDRLVPGAVVPKGHVLARIEDEDYRSAVARQEAAVLKAALDLAMEEGRADVARREWEMLKGAGQDGPGRSLALREPQLAAVKAALKAEREALKTARLNLRRTVIEAPFDAMVIDKGVDVGQVVGPSSNVATLAAEDVFWVEAAVSRTELAWIRFPAEGSREGGSRATVYVEGVVGKGEGGRPARVIGLLGDVEPQGMMARVLVEVERPLRTGGGLPSLPLLLGSYVRVEIEGVPLAGVFLLPRKALRDQGRVYVAGGGGRLEFRKVEVLRRSGNDVLVRGELNDGDRVITSRLDDAVEGMKVRVDGTTSPDPGAEDER